MTTPQEFSLWTIKEVNTDSWCTSSKFAYFTKTYSADIVKFNTQASAEKAMKNMRTRWHVDSTLYVGTEEEAMGYENHGCKRVLAITKPGSEFIFLVPNYQLVKLSVTLSFKNDRFFY